MFISEILKKISLMETVISIIKKVFIFSKTVKNMKASLEIVKKMGLDVTFTKMETYIKDNGLTIKSMEMEPKLIQTNKNT
jgi:hypothetical protein